MYDPKIARFLQEDTYTGDPNDPLSLNLYTYCHNEPIMYTDPTGHEYQLIKANGREYTLEEYAKEQELFRELGRLIDRMENGDKSVSAKDVSKAGGTGFAESSSNLKLFELRGSISNHVDEIKNCESIIKYYADKLSTVTNQKDIDSYKAEIAKAYSGYQSQVSYLQSNWGIEVNGFNVVKNDAYYQSVATVYRYGDQNNSVYKDNIAFDFSNTMLALGELGIAIKGNRILNKSKTSIGDSNKSTNNTEKTTGLKEKAGNFLKGLKDKVNGLFSGGDNEPPKTKTVKNKTIDLSKVKVNPKDDVMKRGYNDESLSFQRDYIKKNGDVYRNKDDALTLIDNGDGTYTIQNGHHRVKAAQQMGMKELKFDEIITQK